MKKIFFLLLFICFSIKSSAQKEYKISYNEKIYFGNKNENIIFKISNKKISAKIIGNEINNYVFENPGEYIISVQEKTKHKSNECDHKQLPEKIIVTVSPFKMKFDANTISFSEPIRKNKETNGIILTISVLVETYEHEPAVLDLTSVNSAGIGTSIIANMDKKFAVLSEGINRISYLLSGKVTENSYLMFDFITSNGTIQSVALLNPIEN